MSDGLTFEDLNENNPCGPTDDETICACGCTGFDERCAYYLAVYSFTKRQVRPEHRCCTIPGRWVCQTLDENDHPCGQPATHKVQGLPGNHWQGAHCDQHTQQAVLNYDHQGGCVVRSIT